ncbi:MAG: hypothetical protein KatS3mg115_2441 [Candidatus Poribacteria bacterium]|nr:MAG: hypothetical protein KatS3mg115_2441 [Candidatus Poribacteria bacterium]
MLENIPLDRLQVLKLPPQDPNWRARAQLPEDGCARFR